MPPITTQNKSEKNMGIHVENLPIQVRVVRDESDLRRAISVRYDAYARHVPEVARQLIDPEPADHRKGTVVLLAESKLDGTPLGTVRSQTNRHAPLALENSVQLPTSFQTQSMAHISRLAIARHVNAQHVKHLLFKGLYQHWVLHDIQWAVVAARRPLDRMYEKLHFQDVFPSKAWVPLAHMGNLPHRIMVFEVATAYQRWIAHAHPLIHFVFHTSHPDLDVTSN